MKLVHKLPQTAARVVKADIDAIIAAGWSEQAAEDVICVTSIFAFFNRMADGFGIGASADVFAMLTPEVAPGLYEPMFNQSLQSMGK